MAYSEKVIDHYENPRNVGSFDNGDDSVGSGMVGAPACGDVMKLQIKVNDKGIIEDARFKTYGCGSAIASSSLVTEWVKGKSLDEAQAIKNTDIAEELGLPPGENPLLYPGGRCDQSPRLRTTKSKTRKRNKAGRLLSLSI
jgi:FeS cluster assembly scaffold IscU